MNFQNLDYFVAVATECNITRAASKLFITQQTLSGQIASLERELGTKLFYRTKPLRLTEAGAVFYHYATGILRDYRSMKNELATITDGGTDTINIGLAFAGAMPVLKDILADFRETSSDTQIQIVKMSGGDLIEKLRDGSLDFALAHFPENDPAFICYPAFEDEIAIMATDELLNEVYGDSAEEVIRDIEENGSYAALKRCPYIRSTKNNIVSHFADRFMAEQIPAPNICAESDSYETILEFCEAGEAFSFFPKRITAIQLGDKTLSPFRVFDLGESARFMINYGYLKDTPKSAAVEAFIKTVNRYRDMLQKRCGNN